MNNDLIHINTLPPFKRMCVSIGNLPSSFMESMTYYEALEWLYNYLDKTVIPAINTEGEAITELQTAFTTLKDYVDNYFENLDVQEEINNKLDEMAESGELADIIAQYLGLAGVLAYNTVADMKLAQNLVNGSTAKTLGYHTINDNGGANYKIRTITNDDVVDDMFIIELNDNSLIAELIIDNNTVNSRQVGLVDNENTNQFEKLQTLINKCITNKYNIYIDKGTIAFSGIINVPETQYGIKINGCNGYSSKLKGLTNSSQIYFNNFLRFDLEKLYFVGTGQETNPLLEINGISHMSNINNCFFASNMALKINNSAYTHINNCSFNNITGYTTSYLLSVKGEYFYATNCYFEGQSNSSAGSKAVIINAGNNYYFDKCDFCNWNNGDSLVIDTQSNSIKDLYIENSTFVRNDISIHSYCDKGINNFVLNNNVFTLLTGNENKIIYNERRAGTSGQLNYFSGRNFIDGSTIDLTKQMFTSSGWMTKCTLEFSSTLGFPDYDDYFRLKFYADFPNNMLIQSGDQTSKTITILSRSPYKAYNLPNLVPIKYNGLQWTDYTVSNTYQGALTITFNFSGTGAYTQAYLKVEDI